MIKKILALSTLALAITGCNSEIDNAQVVSRNGLVFQEGVNDTYSGVVVNVPYGFAGNDGICTKNYEKGRLEGTTECYKNERLVYEASYSVGALDGKEIKYDSETGDPITVKNWEKNALEGLVEQYNKGVLVDRKEYKHGVQDGDHKGWSPDGETVITDITWSNGKPVTGVITENSYRGEYLDGKKNGTWSYFSERNGVEYVFREYQYSSGILNGTAKSFFVAEEGAIAQQAYEAEYKDGEPVSGWLREYDPETGELRQEYKLTKSARANGVDYGDNYPIDFVPDGEIASYFYGIINSYDTWKNGARISSRPNPVSTTSSDAVLAADATTASDPEACTTAWIDAHHKELGEDALISSAMLQEWEGECANGNYPQ